MYQIDVMSRIPVYEQIVEQTEKFILAGILCAGDKIPSVRSMSVELSVIRIQFRKQSQNSTEED